MNSKRRIGYVFAAIGIIIGALMASFSVVCILIPNDAIDYGTAGIAILISKLTGWNLSLCVAGVFLPFLILAFVILGKMFGLAAVVLFPGWLMQFLPNHGLVFNIAYLLAAISFGVAWWLCRRARRNSCI